MNTVEALDRAAHELVTVVTYDDSGVHGRGGNGGLLSRETIRKADELRVALINHERSAITPEAGAELATGCAGCAYSSKEGELNE